jgi:hypothetical protein
MKLVKLLDKPLSAVAGIVGIPESEKITLKESLLVSNDRFTLLQFNHVRTLLVKEFSENAIANLGEFDKNKTYVIKELVKPSEFESFDPSKYEIGDYIFVYAEPEDEDGKTLVHPGEPPKMRKPEVGYKFTLQEFVDAKNEFDKAVKEYESDLESYEEAVKKFITEGEGSKTEFGYLVQIVSSTQYKVIADFSFETTKDTAQFGVEGKLPKDVATKVVVALGGFAEDDSIKGMTITDIITKALGLEEEEDIVGKLLPEDSDEEDSTSSNSASE